MSEVNLLVRVSVKEASIDAIKAEMQGLQEATRQEVGALAYQFYQDRNEPSMFYVQERYRDKDAFKSHAKSEHMAAYLKATEAMIESVTMHKVDPI